MQEHAHLQWNQDLDANSKIVLIRRNWMQLQRISIYVSRWDFSFCSFLSPSNYWQIIILTWAPPANHEFQTGYEEALDCGLCWTKWAWQSKIHPLCQNTTMNPQAANQGTNVTQFSETLFNTCKRPGTLPVKY